MAKVLRLAGLISSIIILLMIILSFLFRRTLKDQALFILQKELKNKLNTEIRINKNDIQLTFLKRFPNASIELKNVLVLSPYSINFSDFNEVNPDTLLYSEKLYLQFSLLKLLRSKYELQKITVSEGIMQVLLDKQGNNNLKIWKQDTTTGNKQFELKLKKVNLDKIQITYVHQGSQQQIHANVEKGSISGNITSSLSTLEIKLAGNILNYLLKNISYLKDESFKVNLNTIFSENFIELSNGILRLEKISLAFNGLIDQLNEKNSNYHVVAENINLPDIQLSYFKEAFKKISIKPKKGRLNFEIDVAGSENLLIKSTFSLEKATFIHLTTKSTINQIYFTGNYTNGKSHNKYSSTLNIDTLYAELNKSWIKGNFKIQNLNNPSVNIHAKGNIELQDLDALLNIEKFVDLSGNLKADLYAKGHLPGFKKLTFRNLNHLRLQGDVYLDEVFFIPVKKGIPSGLLTGQLKVHHNNSVDLKDIQMKTGSSEILVSGTLRNFNPMHTNSGNFPEYKITLQAKYFDCADFFIENPEDETSEEHKVYFPDSLDATIAFNAEEFIFGKFNATNFKGQMIYHPFRLNVRNFSMNSCKGNVSGNLTLKQHASGNIQVIGNSKLTQVDINELFQSFNNFGQEVILAEHLRGKVDAFVELNSSWTRELIFIPSSINVSSRLDIYTGELVDYPPMKGLSRFIDLDELAHIKFDNFSANIDIKNKAVCLDQTQINSSVAEFSGSGIHRFNNSYEYKLQIQLSDILGKKLKKRKKNDPEFGYIVDDNLGKTIIPIIIFGKGAEFQYAYDKKRAKEQFRNKLKAEKEELKKIFNKKENDVEPANDETDKEDKITQSHEDDSGNIIIKNDQMMLQWDPDADDEDDDDFK